MTEASNTPRIPKVGEVWRSRDPRDDGLRVEILEVVRDRVRIQRFRRNWVALRRFHRDYEPVDA